MKKSQLEQLNASLDKALAPPRQKPKANLDALLNEYDDESARKPPTRVDKSGNTSTPRLTSRTSTSSRTSTPNTIQAKGASIAPERDFQRVPNSVTRQAIPQGLFRGKSKQVWDYLYSATRGAILPTRTVRKSRNEIKNGSGLGSMVTVDAAIEHLMRVGLLNVKPAVGSLAGNEYEVFTPEEATVSSASSTSTTSTTSLTQNLVLLDVLESSSTSITQVVENPTVSDHAKTSFKTSEQNTDDEAFAGLNELFQQATINLTGKLPTTGDRDRWRELAELLIAELQIAAARTGHVSNVPAFLTEHLRRRLWKKDKAQLEREGRAAATAPEARPTIDISKCPDCGGAGWFYPDGQERGVAKCRHEKLTAETIKSPQVEST
jgi:hypothetical protein